MGPADVANVLKILETMTALEHAMADFYGACGGTWPEDLPFWSNLAEAELQHAEYIKIMATRLQANPKIFEIARPFSLPAIYTVIAGIEGNLLKLGKGELGRKQVLFLARDMEMSLLESKYRDILKTTDHTYMKMIGEITQETASHHRQIMNRIEEMKNIP